MRKGIFFKVEIPYNRMNVKKAKIFFKKKVCPVECNGDKRVARLKLLLKEVKFNEKDV